jgi:hypothetical protein
MPKKNGGGGRIDAAVPHFVQSYPSRRGQKITGKRFSSIDPSDEDDSAERLIQTLKQRGREREREIATSSTKKTHVGQLPRSTQRFY